MILANNSSPSLFEVKFWIGVILFIRFYYRCTYKNDMKCPATKQVQQKDTSDPPLFSVTYFNHHTCSTSSNPLKGNGDTAAQSSSRKAVSICFSPHTASEQPTFLTSSALPQSPSIHSYRGNQQPERNPYASQFQWTDTSSPTSSGPFMLEVDNVSGASASSSSAGALPRTLLPIGQSRCIEYFHFLWCWHGRRRLYRCWEPRRPLGASLERQVLGGNIVVLPEPQGPNLQIPIRILLPCCLVTFIFKLHFCAWMMWRMVLEFVLLATFVCLEMRLVCLEFLNPDSRVPWSFSATTEILKVTDL